MESKANYTLVGAVVVLLSACFISMLLWLAGGTGKKVFEHYTIYFKNHSLSGLQVDSYVTMKGIVVGSVADFKISSTDIEKVKVNIKIDADTPVKADTSAVISRNLVTGLASVELKGGTAKSQVLSEVFNGEGDPVIPEGETELSAIASSVPGLIDDFSEIVTQSKVYLSSENAENVSQILTNLEKFSTTLASVDEQSVDLLENISRASKSLEGLSGEAEKTFSLMNTKLPKLLGDLESTLKNVEKVSSTLDTESSKLAKSLSSAVDVILIDVNKVTKNISRAAQSVSTAMEKFDDPGAILSGPGEGALGPGERKKK